MTETIILLDTVTKVQTFSDVCQRHKGEVNVFSGKHIVDGKSIMGLLSLNLSEPVKAEFQGDIEDEIKQMIKNFIKG